MQEISGSEATASLVERISCATPGPALAHALGTLDHSLLDDEQALTATAAWMRLQAWSEAGQARALAAFADRRCRLDPAETVLPGRERAVQVGGAGTPLVEEFTSAEAGAVLGMSTGAAQARLADALDLVHRLPATYAALRTGVVDGGRARIAARGTRWLSAGAARRVDARVAPALGRWTWRRCEREVEAAACAAEPVEAQRRRERARAVREVVLGESVDGVRELFARMDAGGATRLDARVDQVAGWLRELGDTDDKAARRATALALLADPSEVNRRWRQVEIVRRGEPATPFGTATGACPDTGQQTGPYGAPVPATTVVLHLRRDDPAGDQWEQDARDGRCPLTVAEATDLLGTSRVTLRPVLDLATVPRSAGYQPSDPLAEAVRLACPHDVFPFSDTPARACELDHDVPWPVGRTELANLSPKAPGHHRVKTHGRWRVEVVGPGAREWTSPTGRRLLVDAEGTWRQPCARRNRPART